MEKTERRSKVLVRVEFLDSPTYQKILGIYLKNSGEAKNLVMSAVSSLFLAVALSNYGNATREELERVARKCRREMLNHISNLDDFFMLGYKINLKSDRPQSDHPQNPIVIKNKNTSSSSSEYQQEKEEEKKEEKKEEDGYEDEDEYEDLSDLSDEEYMKIMKSRIDNPKIKNN